MEGPLLVYDDDCGFCTWCADAIVDHSALRPVGFSELSDDLEARLPADHEECSHLLVDGDIYSCGASIEQAVIHTDIGRVLRPVVEFLRRFDAYTWLRERGYRVVAHNRGIFGRVLSSEPPVRAGPSKRE